MRMYPLRVGPLGLFLVLAIAAVCQADKPDAKIPIVPVVHPVLQEVSDFADFTGRTMAVARVDVRARVSGTLLTASFREGSSVKEGDVLFEIDPRPYRDKLNVAEAAVGVAEAKHRLALANEKRTATLFAQKLTGAEEVDKTKVESAVAQAELRLAKACLEATIFDVNLTRVLAPISGQIGERLVAPGNQIDRGKTTLAVIQSQDPLHILFEVDERTILKMRKTKLAGMLQGDKVTVAVGSADDTGYPYSAVLDFVDNQVDPQKGTIRVRGVLPNKDRLLSPGMSVRVRVTISAPRKALVIPDVPVITSLTVQKTTWVYVVNKQNEVETPMVILGPENNGKREVIEGLKEEDKIISKLPDNVNVQKKVIPEEQGQPTPNPKEVPDSPKPGKSQSSLDRGGPGPVVRAVYPGASAKVIAETVAKPIEFVMQRDGPFYLRSRISYENYLLSTNFARGTSLTEAENSVKNRLAVILNILPPLVIRNDVTVSPGVTGVQLFVNLLSPDDSHDNRNLSLVALLKVRDELARVRGVGALTLLGSSDYGRCVRLDKEKLRAYSLTPIDVKRAFDTEQKAELKSFEKLGDLVVKTNGKGDSLYLRDVATVEIGATKPRAYALVDGKPVVSLMIQPTGSVPPRKLRADLEEKLVEIRKELPKGLELNVTFDFTRNLETPIPATASEYLVVDLQLPEKTTAERHLQTLEQCEAEARKVPGVEHVLALTEHPFDLFGTNPCLLVLLSAAEQRKASRDETIATLRAKLASVKETTVRVRDLSFPGSWPRCGYPIDLALHGPEREKVRQWGTLLQKRLADTKKLTDVWTSPEPSLKTQFEINIDLAISKPEGLQPEEIISAAEAALKIDLSTVKHWAKFGRTLEFVLDSRRIIGFSLRGKIWQADSEEDDHLPAPEKAIGNAKVRCANGEMIPVSKFVKIKRSEVPVVDEFLDGKPMVQFSANVAPGVSAEQGRKLCETLAEETRKELKLPAEYRLTWLQ